MKQKIFKPYTVKALAAILSLALLFSMSSVMALAKEGPVTQEQYEQAVQDKTNLETQISALASELETLASQKEMLAGELELAQMQLPALQRSEAEKTSALTTALEAKKAGLLADIQQMEEEIAPLETAMQEAVLAYNTAKSLVDTKEAALAQMIASDDSEALKQMQIANAEAELASANTALDAANAEKADADATLLKLQNDYTAAVTDYAALSAAWESARTALAEAEGKKGEAEEVYQTAFSELEEVLKDYKSNAEFSLQVAESYKEAADTDYQEAQQTLANAEDSETSALKAIEDLIAEYDKQEKVYADSDEYKDMMAKKEVMDAKKALYDAEEEKRQAHKDALAEAQALLQTEEVQSAVLLAKKTAAEQALAAAKAEADASYTASEQYYLANQEAIDNGESPASENYEAMCTQLESLLQASWDASDACMASDGAYEAHKNGALSDAQYQVEVLSAESFYIEQDVADALGVYMDAKAPYDNAKRIYEAFLSERIIDVYATEEYETLDATLTAAKQTVADATQHLAETKNSADIAADNVRYHQNAFEEAQLEASLLTDFKENYDESFLYSDSFSDLILALNALLHEEQAYAQAKTAHDTAKETYENTANPEETYQEKIGNAQAAQKAAETKVAECIALKVAAQTRLEEANAIDPEAEKETLLLPFRNEIETLKADLDEKELVKEETTACWSEKNEPFEEKRNAYQALNGFTVAGLLSVTDIRSYFGSYQEFVQAGTDLKAAHIETEAKAASILALTAQSEQTDTAILNKTGEKAELETSLQTMNETIAVYESQSQGGESDENGSGSGENGGNGNSGENGENGGGFGDENGNGGTDSGENGGSENGGSEENGSGSEENGGNDETGDSTNPDNPNQGGEENQSGNNGSETNPQTQPGKTPQMTTKDISSCYFTYIATHTYTGKAITPDVVVKKGKTTLKKSVHYTVTYQNNKKVGTASIVFRGKGEWTGAKTIKFTINPKMAKLKKVVPARKALTVTWIPQKKEISGYEIQYSTRKNFIKDTRKVKVKAKKSKLKIKKLKAKKTYYVRIRTYKIVKGKVYYSDWSTTKKKRTK